jgi:hypothetical protein
MAFMILTKDVLKTQDVELFLSDSQVTVEASIVHLPDGLQNLSLQKNLSCSQYWVVLHFLTASSWSHSPVCKCKMSGTPCCKTFFNYLLLIGLHE